MNSSNQEDARTQSHQTSRTERACLGISVLIFLVTMLSIAIFFPEVTAFQEFIFRTVMALTAGASAAFIPGFFHLKIAKGQLFLVRAGGAIAVAAFIYYVNPPSSVSERTDAGEPKIFVHEGLVRNLENHIAEGTGFSLVLDPERITELRKLYIDETGGNNWGELFSKICLRYPNCLVCNPPPGRITDHVTLSLTGPPLDNFRDSSTGNVKQCPGV